MLPSDTVTCNLLRCLTPFALRLADLSASFDELAELSTSQALGASKRQAGPASPEALADAFPEGSDTRRAAVGALGHQVHARMLHVNVVPSSAMLGAALLPAAVFAATAQSEPEVRPPLLSAHVPS